MSDSESETTGAEPNEATVVMPGVSDEHIRSFQNRSKVYFASTIIVVLTIFSLIAGAAYVFFFAQDIERGTGKIELYKQLGEEIKLHQDIVKRGEQLLQNYQEQFDVGQRTLLDVANLHEVLSADRLRLAALQEKQKIFEDIGFLVSIEQFNTKEEFQAQLPVLKKTIEFLKSASVSMDKAITAGIGSKADLLQMQDLLERGKLQLKRLQGNIKLTPEAKEQKTRIGDLDVLNLVSTSLLRFGGIGITLFLISILIPIYRYNTRLAAFYLARADALLLCKEGGATNFSALCAELTPAHAFEKEPATPFSTLSDLAKEGVKVARKV